MKTFFFSLSIAIALSVGGQATKKAKIVKEKFVTIKMQKFPIVDKFETTIPVSDIQVLQMVRDSVRLGFSTKGVDDYVVTLKSDKPLTGFIQEHITRMYKKQYQNGGVKILLLIRELREGEKEAFIPYAYTRLYAYTNLHVDAYLSESGNLFTRVYSIDSVFVNQLGANMTANHAECIEKALKFVVKKTLWHTQNGDFKPTDKMTADAIIAGSKQQIDMPILTDEVYKDGAYKSFEEFLNNNPSVTDYEPIFSKKKKVDIVNLAKDTIAVWGFCKNGEIYRYYEKALIPIEKQGSGFIISDYVQSKTRRNYNRIGSSFAFGFYPNLIGAIGSAITVTSWLREGRPILVTSYSYIDDAEHQPEATCINMKTGEFGF